MFASRHEPVLGTTLELRIDTCDEQVAAAAQDAVLAEFDRLERVFSVYDEASELRCWQRDQGLGTSGGPVPRAELAALLRGSLDWQRRSGGAYNPAVGRLTARWKQAEQSGVVPDHAELAALAAAIAEPPYSIADDGTIVAAGDIGALSFNAIAKGLVVDAAAAAAMRQPGVRAVTVSAGGDLVQRGEETIAVGVENPFTPFDNAAPLTVVSLRDGGVATSGSARRGFTVGDRRFGHVIDPRTGWPIEHTVSATVIAADAMTADVVATVVGVLAPADALAFADSVGAACLIVPKEGPVFRNERWISAERRPSSRS